MSESELKPSLKERFNKKINNLADRHWEDVLRGIDRGRTQEGRLIRGLERISGATLVDALALEVLEFLARASGGRVIRSRIIAERLPHLNRNLYQIDLPKDESK